MRLVHYSDAETVVPESRDQSDDDRMKPRGLWITDEDEFSWATMLADQDPAIEDFWRGANAFAVTLADDANILTLGTRTEVREFDAEFNRGPYAPWAIDWKAVAERWQGILITPYQWSLRFSEVYWYYSWDCACGVVWDAAAFAGFTPIPGQKRTPVLGRIADPRSGGVR